MMFNLGGSNAEASDPNLRDKIAALKRGGKPADERMQDFLRRDLGIDPRTLPFDRQQADEFFKRLLSTASAEEVGLNGDSLGLHTVKISRHGDDETITADTPGTYDWHDITRAYQALTKSQPGMYSFQVGLQYPEVVAIPIAANPLPSTDPETYPSGSILRIDNGVTQQYIRIGGLFDDTTPTNLDTFEPIVDLSGWSVTEELMT